LIYATQNRQPGRAMKIVHISDIHINAEPILGLDPVESFRECQAHVEEYQTDADKVRWEQTTAEGWIPEARDRRRCRGPSCPGISAMIMSGASTGPSENIMVRPIPMSRCRRSRPTVDEYRCKSQHLTVYDTAFHHVEHYGIEMLPHRRQIQPDRSAWTRH
jgi:hypothetical protein